MCHSFSKKVYFYGLVVFSSSTRYDNSNIKITASRIANGFQMTLLSVVNSRGNEKYEVFCFVLFLFCFLIPKAQNLRKKNLMCNRTMLLLPFSNFCTMCIIYPFCTFCIFIFIYLFFSLFFYILPFFSVECYYGLGPIPKNQVPEKPRNVDAQSFTVKCLPGNLTDTASCSKYHNQYFNGLNITVELSPYSKYNVLFTQNSEVT